MNYSSNEDRGWSSYQIKITQDLHLLLSNQKDKCITNWIDMEREIPKLEQCTAEQCTAYLNNAQPCNNA